MKGNTGQGHAVFDCHHLSGNSDCRLLQAQPGACRGDEQAAGYAPLVSYLLLCAQALRSRAVSHCGLLSLFSCF